MDDLIERLESAAIGGRDLDAEIALAIGYVTERDGNLFFGNKDHTTLVLERDYYDHGGAAPELPHHTTSIDAADTLRPHDWRVVCIEQQIHGLQWEVELHTFDDDRAVIATAATEPLARCAAALKARKS